MSDDYLWDRSGRPDPDVRELEDLLGGLRYDGALPELPPQDAASAGGGSPLLAMAAAALLTAGAALLFSARPAAPDTRVANPTPKPTPTAGWKVDWLSGEGAARLQVGDWIETDTRSRARIQVATIGKVELEPSSRLRLVATDPKQHRLELAVGKLHARVTAPPRLFLVDTPSAQTVDLGCEYTLTVAEDGASLLEVRLGFVAFEWKGLEAIVPRGARCETRPGQGPGIPHYRDAPLELRQALEVLAFAPADALRQRKLALLRAIGVARAPRDALSLWHLLPRVRGPFRRKAYAALARMVPPPPGVTAEGIQTLDRTMLAAWKDQMEWSW